MDLLLNRKQRKMKSLEHQISVIKTKMESHKKHSEFSKLSGELKNKLVKWYKNAQNKKKGKFIRDLGDFSWKAVSNGRLMWVHLNRHKSLSSPKESPLCRPLWQIDHALLTKTTSLTVRPTPLGDGVVTVEEVEAGVILSTLCLPMLSHHMGITNIIPIIGGDPILYLAPEVVILRPTLMAMDGGKTIIIMEIPLPPIIGLPLWPIEMNKRVFF